MSKTSKQVMKKAKTAVLQTAVVILALFLLWVLVHEIVGNESLVPSVGECLLSMWRFFGDSGFWLAFASTFLRVIVVFIISMCFALICAFISYLVPWFLRIITPIVAFLRTLPVLAALLIILIWAGAGGAPIVVAFLSLFPMLYTGIFTALCNVDKGIEELNRVYKVPLKKQIAQFYLPTILPSAIREGSGGLAFALKLVVSAEVLADTYHSLGGLMKDAKLYYEIPALFALVLIVCLLGFIVETVGILLADGAERRAR